MEQDFPRAHYVMGLIYFQGLGVEAHWGKSLEFLERAVELGCPDALSLRNRVRELSEKSLAEPISEGSKRLAE